MTHNPWLDSVLAIALSSACAFIAIFWRRGWAILMTLGILVVAVCWLAAHHLPRRWHGYAYSAALPWIALPLLRFKLTPITRFGLIFNSIAATLYGGWMEFLSPALARAELAQLGTNMNGGGICLQSTSYTCGPAAAVTALRRLGFPAEEGDLALLANSSNRTGTDPTDLAAAIVARFGPSGARVDERPLDTLDDLQRALPAMTVIQWDAVTDHWIVVLEMNDREVHCADPARGRWTDTRKHFQEIWEHETIRIWKE